MATDEIDDVDDELEEYFEDVEGDLKKAKKASGREKDRQLRKVERRLKTGKTLLTAFKVEMRELSSVAVVPYEAKRDAHTRRMEKLEADVRWARNDADRGELVGANADEERGTQDMLDEAAAIQARSKQSTAHSRRMVEQAKAVGAATATRLHEQTDQLDRITGDVDQVEENLDRADRQLKSFMRRMGTDRVILCLLCIIVLGIVFAIIYSLIDPDGASESTNVPDDLVPQF